jgi:hypothetical protein
LLGSGGTADLIPELMKTLPGADENLVIYDDEPARLVKRIVELLDKKYADIHRQLAEDYHWYLHRDSEQSPPPRAG